MSDEAPFQAIALINTNSGEVKADGSHTPSDIQIE